MHLAPNGCVAIRFKMLTYFVYAPLLNRIDALPLSVSYYFGDGFFIEKHLILTYCVYARTHEFQFTGRLDAYINFLRLDM